MSKKIRFKGIVATLAQIAADAFAGRISWASDLARPVHYYTDSDYAVLARKDVAETFPGVKITNQAGPVARMVQAGTDGTQSAVSAETARSTIGAQAALGYTPVNKAGDTMTGGLTLTSLVNSATAGTGIRPKVALADGTDSAQDAATFRATIDAAKTSHTHAYSTITSIPAAIDAIDGLTPAADRIAYYTGANAASLATLSAFGRSLIDDADAATARATLGVSGSSIDPSPTGSFYSGSPLSLSIGGYRHIQLWMYAGSGASHNLTITPSGGGSVTIGLGAWNCWVDISFDKYNTCVVRTSSSSGETFNSFASGNSSSITLNSDVPSGWSVAITRTEMT